MSAGARRDGAIARASDATNASPVVDARSSDAGERRDGRIDRSIEPIGAGMGDD